MDDTEKFARALHLSYSNFFAEEFPITEKQLDTLLKLTPEWNKIAESLARLRGLEEL